MIRSYEMLTFCYLFCLENRTKGDLSPKTRRKELQEPVQQFYDNFREVYLDLTKKTIVRSYSKIANNSLSEHKIGKLHGHNLYSPREWTSLQIKSNKWIVQ